MFLKTRVATRRVTVDNEMSEDYLWNKSGSDDEIEHLERLLSEFRADVSAVPVMPTVGTVTDRVSAVSGWLGIVAWLREPRFALGAVLPIVALLVLVWFQMKPAVRPVGIDAVADSAAVPEVVALPEGDRVLTVTPPAAVNGTVVPAVSRQRNNFAHLPGSVRRRVSPRRIVPAESRNDEFSAEERRAYDQLILALSVTGAKLKIVSDAVQGERSALAPTAK